MIIVNVFDPKLYDIYVHGFPFTSGNLPIDARCSMENWQRKYELDWVFNYAFFNLDNYQNRIKNCAGRTLQYCYNPEIGTIGYNSSSNMSMPAMEFNTGCKFTGWKWAIKDGLVQNSNLNSSSKRARNMNGFTSDGKYIHVTSDPQTEIQVATYTNNQIKKLYGTTVKYLFIEDAGGSTQEYSGISKLGYYPEGQRYVPTVIGIKRKNKQAFTRVLSKGMKGSDIMALQQILGGIEIDGSFGPATDKRLRQAQRTLGLDADGYAGPMTYEAMGYYFKSK